MPPDDRPVPALSAAPIEFEIGSDGEREFVWRGQEGIDFALFSGIGGGSGGLVSAQIWEHPRRAISGSEYLATSGGKSGTYSTILLPVTDQIYQISIGRGGNGQIRNNDNTAYVPEGRGAGEETTVYQGGTRICAFGGGAAIRNRKHEGNSNLSEIARTTRSWDFLDGEDSIFGPGGKASNQDGRVAESAKSIGAGGASTKIITDQRLEIFAGNGAPGKLIIFPLINQESVMRVIDGGQ